MPACALCGRDDYEVSADVHFVQIDIVYIGSADDLTAKLKRMGWEFKVFQGRPCRYRFTCIDCLRSLDESKNAWREIDDERRAAEDSKTSLNEFYAPLCN